MNRQIMKSPTYGELVEAQHVHDPDLRDDGSVQVGTLVGARSHQQAPVGAPLDGELGGGAVAVLCQVFGSCLEIVKHILLVLLGARLPPLDAVLPPSPAKATS